MYAALWRLLPGPIWLRLLICLILVVGVLVVLDAWVFPWVQANLIGTEATLE